MGPSTRNGTRGVGVGGTVANIDTYGTASVKGAPWTQSPMMAQGRTQSGAIATFSTAGFLRGPQSNTSTVLALGGVMQLVTPIVITRTYPLPGDRIALFGRLTVRVVPEPHSTLLLASAIAGLLLLERKRIER